MSINRHRYKFGLLAYWLLFAIFSAFAASSPGYVHHPELVPYPWHALLVLWAFFGVLLALLYVILQPPEFRTSPWRLPLALLLGIAMSVPAAGTLATTDLPGLSYAPAVFALTTTLFLVVIAAVTIIGVVWRKYRVTP
jgi:hypothetical protein